MILNYTLIRSHLFIYLNTSYWYSGDSWEEQICLKNIPLKLLMNVLMMRIICNTIWLEEKSSKVNSECPSTKSAIQIGRISVLSNSSISAKTFVVHIHLAFLSILSSIIIRGQHNLFTYVYIFFSSNLWRYFISYIQESNLCSFFANILLLIHLYEMFFLYNQDLMR